MSKTIEKEIHGENVYWKNKVGGYGFVKKDNTIALVRCPSCGRENYAMNVLSGQCTWCPFNAND